MPSSLVVDIADESESNGYIQVKSHKWSNTVIDEPAVGTKDCIQIVINDDKLQRSVIDSLLQDGIRECNGKLPIRDVKVYKVKPLNPSYTGRYCVRPGGKLSLDSPRVQLNRGSQSKPAPQRREIFRGYYENDIDVAIQKVELLRGLVKEVEREFRILRELDNHENFIRYFCHESDEENNFLYIATELCICSVADLYSTGDQKKWDQIREKLTAKEILRQATTGLQYLHLNHFVHRNVKPSSFLIKKISAYERGEYVVKITDFRLSRPLDPDSDLSGSTASQGWVAPEMLRDQQKLHTSLDVFILGCFFHYVLTGDGFLRKPVHPFGSTETERHGNILNPRFQVYSPSWNPIDVGGGDIIKLVKNMLQYNEMARFTLTQVLQDPYFQRPNRECYPMYEKEKNDSPGLCVIFSNEKFIGPQRLSRPESARDCRNLDKTFSALGYDVKKYADLVAHDLKAKVKELARKKKFFSRYGSLVVCLLSHGDEAVVYGSDLRPVNINKLKFNFSFNDCPDLYGKPKIFIIQACRGRFKQTAAQPMILQGVKESILAGSNKAKLNALFHEQMAKYFENADQMFKIPDRGPQLMDFITIYSSLPGFVSFSDKDNGSYFITSLCEKLNAEYVANDGKERKQRDLEEVLREVQTYMNRIALNSRHRQTMQWEVCLNKYILFQRAVRDEPIASSPMQTTEEEKEDYFYYVRHDEPPSDITDGATPVPVAARPRANSNP